MKSPQFLFYVGSDLIVSGKLEESCQCIFKDIDKFEMPGFSIYTPRGFMKRMFAHDGNLFCGISGWIRSDRLSSVDFHSPTTFLPHLLRAAHVLSTEWPIVSSDIEGNFSGLLFNSLDRTLLLFSDPGSIYPLYYARYSSGWLGGTHLLTLNRVLKTEIDLTGVVEQLSPPHFVSYGRRTILQGVSRVLPGESIKCSFDSDSIQRTYDNTFFSRNDIRSVTELAEAVWSEYTQAVRSCVGETKNINLGLSGGWDSRLIAAALKNKPVKCYTYGVDENEYEVELARKIAGLMQAQFNFFDFSAEWAPRRERFVQNLFATESTYITEWLSLLSRFDTFSFEPFLLGDMFEVVAGRNLQRLSSREGRKRLYWRRVFGNNSLPVIRTGDFDLWRNTQIKHVISYSNLAVKNLKAELQASNKFNEIIDEIVNDIDELFMRIRDHNLVYVDTFDELLIWYLRGIYGIGRQVLSLNEAFFGFAPTMSFRAIRLVSGIYPFLRVSGIVMAQIQKVRGVSAFSKIPSAHAPYIPSSAPLWFSDLVWAGRSSADQLLVHLARQRRNLKAPLRLVKTFNFVKLYNILEAQENVETWFLGKILKPDAYLKLFNDRANMNRKPLGSWDITGPASVSLMTDLLDSEEQCLTY